MPGSAGGSVGSRTSNQGPTNHSQPLPQLPIPTKGPCPKCHRDQVRWAVSDQSCHQSDLGLHWDNSRPCGCGLEQIFKKPNPPLLQFPVQMISQGSHMAFVKAHEHLLILFPFHLLLSQCHVSPKGRLQSRLWTGSYTSYFVCSFPSCTSNYQKQEHQLS